MSSGCSSPPGCSAYVIGEAGLLNALYDAGVSTRENIKAFAYQPTVILEGVGDIPRQAH